MTDSGVRHIFIAEKRGAPMLAVTTIEALADVGLRGDRYAAERARRSPDYQVTLIELENVKGFAETSGVPLSAEMPRRNIVTVGVRLNDLLGRRFTVGKAVFEGLELCEPCRLFAKRTHLAVLDYFRGKGGLRARIVLGGLINIGDRIAALPNRMTRSERQ